MVSFMGDNMRAETDEKIKKQYLNLPLVRKFIPDSVFDKVSIFRVDSDEYIVDMRFDLKYLYLLLDGRAKIYVNQEDGRFLLLDYIEYPSIIGEVEMKGNTTNCTIKALTPCTLLAIPFSVINEYLTNDLQFWKTLYGINGNKIKRQVDHCVNTITYPSEVRCAHYIYKNSYNLIYKEPHTEASAYLGITYRHFLHIIDSLVKKKILEKTSIGYKIINEEELIKIFKGNAYMK